jgi:hypothetical protein
MEKKVYFSHSRMIDAYEKIEVLQAISRLFLSYEIIDSEEIELVKSCHALVIFEHFGLVSDRVRKQVEEAKKYKISVYAIRRSDIGFKLYEVEGTEIVNKEYRSTYS